MYLSPTDIQQSRLRTLDSFHEVSRAWVDAAERLSELAVRAGRQALEEGRWHLDEIAESHQIRFDGLPLERINDWRGESAELVSECFEIIGDAQQAIMRMARNQVAVFDQLLMRQMEHAEKSLDANGEAAIGHMKTALRQAETTFNDLADAAAHGTEQVEEQVRKFSEALAAEPDPTEHIEVPPPAPRGRRTRSA